MSLVVSATNDLTNSFGTVSVKVGEITGFLDGVVQKLQSLKRKVNENFLCISTGVGLTQNNSTLFLHCQATIVLFQAYK